MNCNLELVLLAGEELQSLVVNEVIGVTRNGIVIITCQPQPERLYLLNGVIICLSSTGFHLN